MPAGWTASIRDSQASDPEPFPVSIASPGCSCGVAFEGRLGRAYNQEAFRYFLAIEQARAKRSGRSLLLVLLSAGNGSGEALAFPPRIATKAFDALAHCTRDVDFRGWYTQDRVAAAVLIQDHATPTGGDVVRIRTRIDEALYDHVPSAVARELRVRVLEMGTTRQQMRDAEPAAMAATAVSGL